MSSHQLSAISGQLEDVGMAMLVEERLTRLMNSDWDMAAACPAKKLKADR